MKRNRPSLYLDTNVLSALRYDGGSIQGMHRRLLTREWWGIERKHFAVFASQFTETELKRGEYPGQEEALAEVRRLPYLSYIKEVDRTAEVFVDSGVVPRGQFSDAIQLAFATVYVIDYLLTWNYAHLMNPEVQLRVSEINGRLGIRTPLIESPESMPKISFGQRIRRKSRK